MTTTEQHLQQFYRELQAWVERGSPDLDPFSDFHGICPLVGHWARRVLGFGSDHQVSELKLALKHQFGDAGLDEKYPFNSGADGYMGEEKPYANPARLAWIKARAAGEPTPTPNNIEPALADVEGA